MGIEYAGSNELLWVDQLTDIDSSFLPGFIVVNLANNKPYIMLSGGAPQLVGAPQVNSDWNATIGVAAISNKPTAVSAFTNDAGYLTSLPTKSFNNNPMRSIVTGTGATGFQVSSSRDAEVNYSIAVSTTVSLSGNATGYVVLEVAPTNSATPSDWVEIARTTSGQSGTLVVGLTLTQLGGGQIGGVIPAGYYVKIRSVNTAGTPTYTYNSGQEVLL